MEPFLGAGAPAKPSKPLERGIKILVLTSLERASEIDPQKNIIKIAIKRSIWRLWRPNAPESEPKRVQKGLYNESEIGKLGPHYAEALRRGSWGVIWVPLGTILRGFWEIFLCLLEAC